jgi:hypothetical protein
VWVVWTYSVRRADNAIFYTKEEVKMKQTIVILSLLLACTLFSPFVFAESQAEKYLGERKNCLETMMIKETRILDDQTILLETYGGAVYISRLPAPCVGLRIAEGFSYSTSISKLCKQDIIEVVNQGPFRGTGCGLGEFILIKGVRRLRDAVELLKNGVLEALVEENVFETAFPTEKSE